MVLGSKGLEECPHLHSSHKHSKFLQYWLKPFFCFEVPKTFVVTTRLQLRSFLHSYRNMEHVSAILGFVPQVFLCQCMGEPSFFMIEVQRPSPEVFVVLPLPGEIEPFVNTWTFSIQSLVHHAGTTWISIPDSCASWLLPGLLTPGMIQEVERKSPNAVIKHYFRAKQAFPTNDPLSLPAALKDLRSQIVMFNEMRSYSSAAVAPPLDEPVENDRPSVSPLSSEESV